MVGISGLKRCSISFTSDSVTGLSQLAFVLMVVLRSTTKGQPSTCNNCLATLAQAISLGVRNLAFSSIVWTCDVACTCVTFSWDEGVLEILLEVDCLPEHIDYQPVCSQKYLCRHLTELEMYLILTGIEWDTVWLYCQTSAHLSWIGGQTTQCHNQAILP